jgi:hypothetical protein
MAITGRALAIIAKVLDGTESVDNHFLEVTNEISAEAQI